MWLWVCRKSFTPFFWPSLPTFELFVSLSFVIFLALFLFGDSPCLSGDVVLLFSKDCGGSAQRNILLFFRLVSLLSSQKQGREGQGVKVEILLTCFKDVDEENL